ncbi:tetratricopeptide repeat protein [Pirellulaceae bacterium]|nr:tetratricopeptide repeat protein [Pirellulaceae bacterium]
MIVDQNKAIRLDPTIADAYNTRGLAYLAKWEPDKAIADFNKAIELNPYDAIFYENRGRAYSLWNRDLEKAYADWDKAKELGYED